MKDNLIKRLITIIIVLTVGIVGISTKIIIVEKTKKNQDASINIDKIPGQIKDPIVVNPPKEEPIVEEPIIEEPPVEPLPIEEPVVKIPKENPPIVKPPQKEPIKENIPHKKDEEKIIVSPKYISKEEAIAIGLKKVGVGSILVEIEEDLGDNPPKYELEIILGNYEYELEIHAITGAVIDFEKDEID